MTAVRDCQDLGCIRTLTPHPLMRRNYGFILFNILFNGKEKVHDLEVEN